MHSERHDEREALARTFLTHGPEAATILPGWDAAELLEHLLLREGAPQLKLGTRLPGPLGARAQRTLDALRESPWQDRVARFRQGPGRFSPIGRIDALSGQGELLIHHEDLRRAQPGWEPRLLAAEAAADAWRAVGLMAPLAMRVRAEVTLVSPLGGRQLRSRRAVGSLRVHGDPLELLLWVSGRGDVARVRVHGDQAALQALQEGRRGL
ncbi:MAG: TIGR03085 family metal-binding protein [Brachybacterium sp.]|nr:TIGR03085 family metal-binding protein [Brachybacterium sp.]